ncbi:unnamed protein product [Rotaria sordida]|uniref:F-box domain-containing protein n=1 Tax=Rotaria sordida TaxID=392033 RepID=A0A815I104_9BILA|nr:unnamed protein product [Rotaria sordida]CAF1606211.1 unnamed protein product [Rotaria sordida]
MSQPLVNQTKRLPSTFIEENVSITCIEHLSNELLYEVFDYLDGCEIYRVFCNLNSRFQYLITCLSFLLKIKIRPRTQSELMQSYENIILPNRHRLLSLSFEETKVINDFFENCILDSSFNRLQSIVLKDVEAHNSLFVFSCLKLLPHLVSLTMSMTIPWFYNLNHIYRTILSFPALKYNKLSLPPISQCNNPNIFIPVTINEKLNTIEYLVIDHHCAFFELYSLIYHTPQLRYLICRRILKRSDRLANEKPIMLPNLTHISIDICVKSPDHLGLFMTKLFAPVQALRIKYHRNTDHLDDNGWEQLIRTNLPYLRRFHYENHQCFSRYEENDFDYTKINQFTSSFWVKRQWYGKLVLNMHNICDCCSIFSHDSAWFIVSKYPEIVSYSNKNNIIMSNSQPMNNFSTQFVPPIVFRSNDNPTKRENQFFLDKFKSAFVDIHFTHLNINCKNICINMLLKIIQLLPYLNSLKVSSLPIIQSDLLFSNHGKILSSTLINNKITEVSLENVNHIEQVYFILYLCHRMQYFQLDVPKDIDLNVLVRFILKESAINTRSLNSLYLSIPNANEYMIDQLQKLITSEKLLLNFNIKCICNNIFVKWC